MTEVQKVEGSVEAVVADAKQDIETAVTDVETAAKAVEAEVIADAKTMSDELTTEEQLFIAKAKLALAKLDNRYAALKVEEKNIQQESQQIIHRVDAFIQTVAKRIGKSLDTFVFDVENEVWKVRADVEAKAKAAAHNAFAKAEKLGAEVIGEIKKL